MSPPPEETQALPGQHHLLQSVRDATRPQQSAALDFLSKIRSSLLASDASFECLVHRIETSFSPHSERAQEFFGPALSGLVGCAVFAFFDCFGVGNMAHGGSSPALIQETIRSFESPFFQLAMFLLSLAIILGSSDGRNTVARWLIAPFLELTQHVTMLGLGVFLAMAVNELGRGLTPQLAAQTLGTSAALVAIAYVCALGVDFCRGRWSRLFERHRGRQVLALLAGIALAASSAESLVQYAKKQEAQTGTPKTSQGTGH